MKLGDILINKGLIKQNQLEQALKIQAAGSRRLGHILIKMRLITEDQLADVMAEQNNQFKTTDYLRVDEKKLFPRYLCSKYSCVPLCLSKEDNILTVAMSDPLDNAALTALEDYTMCAINPVIARESMIREAIQTIPYSINDFFNSDNAATFTKIFAAGFVVVLILIGSYYSRLAHIEKYGSVTSSENSTIYSNKDILIEKTGIKLKLMGRGAHSSSSFSIQFANEEKLKNFLEDKKKLFSSEQIDYIHWVLGQE